MVAIAEESRASVLVHASGWYIRPSIPRRKNTGKNETTMINVASPAGMATVAHALATARMADGEPILRATSVYVQVSPRGISVSARQTRHWNAVPRMSMGRSGETSFARQIARAASANGVSNADGPGAIVAAGNSRSRAATSVLTD